MNNFSNQQLSLEVNELARERSRKAAERTLATWIQVSLVLMGSGIAVDQIIRSLNYFFPYELHQGLTSLLGLGAIALSLLLLVFASLEHALQLRAIENGYSLHWPFVRHASAINLAILFGLLVLCVLVLVPR
ncbi:MAG TPA: DUF202 domain-containing protein [Leptolyngbyaceae cyanobacterium]